MIRVQVPTVGLVAQAPTARRTSVVASAKALKAADVRGMSIEDIDKQVKDTKMELFNLRLAQATRQEFKPSDFQKLRKKVAVLLTVRREKEIADGVTMRESRKLEKKRRLEAGEVLF